MYNIALCIMKLFTYQGYLKPKMLHQKDWEIMNAVYKYILAQDQATFPIPTRFNQI